MFYRFNGTAAAVTLLLSTTAHSAHAANPQAAASTPPKIETIIVTGSPLSNDPDKLATIVGQVNRDEILRSGGANLADALANVPGVTGSNFAAGSSRPVIRGFDASRVRILENGVGSFDVSDVGADHGVPIDPLSTQKIEVVRGAATLRYGSQAIGGVVNAINNRIPLELSDKPFSGEVSGTYGTAADTRQGGALADTRVGQFAVHADGFIRRTNDYDTPLGIQSNSFFRGDGASLGGSYFFGDGDQNRVGAAVVHYDAKYGIPAEANFIDMKLTKGLFGSSFTLDAGTLQKLTVDGGYADYKHSERDPTGVALSTFIDKEWDSRAEALLGALGPFSASAIGAQVQHREVSALGEGADYLSPTATKSFAGFAFTEAPMTKGLRLQMGLRVEHVGVSGTPASNVPTDRKFTPVSGSAGLLLETTDAVSLGLTFASAARAPAQTELFARGPHDAPGTFEIGDPALGIERANSLEGTVRARAKGIEFEAAVWGAKFSNYIFGRLTGRTCDGEGNCIVGDTAELKELLYEQRGATFYGLEGKATASLMEVGGGTLGLNVLADYVRAELQGGAGNVPRIPPYHVGGGLFWESRSIDASFLLKYSGAQNKVASAAETPTKGFANLDAQVAWRPWLANPKVELALIGRNLTDRIQRNATALNKDEVVLPGRDIRLAIRTAF
ncbi:MAG: TonB-dependent receptor [Rhodospirillaceae bacterium]|nr:TonB-dependent receptor [Rhodospirillaceae bacterium]